MNEHTRYLDMSTGCGDIYLDNFKFDSNFEILD